jgi:putative addiction module antidote
MVKLTIRRVGNSLGVLLPSSTTRAMRVKEGDVLFLIEGPDGFRITPYDPDFERQMRAAEKVLKRHKNALRELSKR